MLTEKLFPHLAEIDEACHQRLEVMIPAMAEQEGVTAALKRANQMEWVRRMNSIRARAEEVILAELVYADQKKRQVDVWAVVNPEMGIYYRILLFFPVFDCAFSRG